MIELLSGSATLLGKEKGKCDDIYVGNSLCRAQNVNGISYFFVALCDQSCEASFYVCYVMLITNCSPSTLLFTSLLRLHCGQVISRLV